MVVVCAATWLGAFVATHVPQPRLPYLVASDKVLHFAGFLLLSSLLLLTVAAFGAARTRRVVMVIFTVMVYAALDEITQPLTGRHASVLDWAADVAGALAGVVIVEAALHFLGRFDSSSAPMI